MTVINTNVKSLVAQSALSANSKNLATAMERLSTGKRINSAADDAAGLAISSRMTSQVRGLNMAIRNANDGISLLQTAEGAMEETTNMLQRMRELSLQASNATYSASDRASLQAEVDQLKSEIDRIASTTQFNGQNILDGSYSNKMLQISDRPGSGLDVSLNAITSAVLGERSDGPATAASYAKLDVQGMSTTSADYYGKSFSVNVNGTSTTVALPSSAANIAVNATLSSGVVGSDVGPATSMVLGNGSFSVSTLDMTTAAKRVFSLRVNDSSVVNVDISSALATELGVTIAELNSGASSTADEVTKEQFITAVQNAITGAGFVGDNAVTVSVDEDGQLMMRAAGDGFVSIGDGLLADGATAGTFVDNFIDTAGLTEPSNSANLSTYAKQAFKLTVNGGTATMVQFDDLLSDSSYVKNVTAVTSRELVNVIQTRLDEIFTGDDAVTVGVDPQGYMTLSVAGGARTVVVGAGTMSDGSTTSTGGANIFGTLSVDNNDATINFAAIGIDNVVDAFDDADLVVGVRVNGSALTNIDMTEYIRSAAADVSAVSQDEMVAAMQAAFDDHFTGEDAVTVTGYSDGTIGVTVAGGAQYVKLSEYAPLDGSADGDFLLTVAGSSTAYVSNGQLRPDDSSYAYKFGTQTFSDTRGNLQLFKDPFSLDQKNAVTTTVDLFSDKVRAAAKAVLTGFVLNDTLAININNSASVFTYTVTSADAADATMETLAKNVAAAINADSTAGAAVLASASYTSSSTSTLTLTVRDDSTNALSVTGSAAAATIALVKTGTGTVTQTAVTDRAASAAITIDGDGDAITVELDGSGNTATLSITQGTYANLEAVATEMNRLIAESDAFKGENAIRVVVKEGYDDFQTTAPTDLHRFLAIESDFGKVIEIGGDSAYLFGTETNTVIDSSKILSSVTGSTYEVTTHGLTSGGVDTTQGSGVIDVQIQSGTSTIQRSVTLGTQSANQTFAAFAADLSASINSAFSADGFSVTTSYANGAMTLMLNQSGENAISLSGDIIADAFGSSSISAQGVVAGSALSSMDDVVAAINEDLTVANAGAVAAFDSASGTLSFEVVAGTPGTSSSISLSGTDLTVLQFSSTSATGSAGNATAAKVSELDISTYQGALDAIESIDNALTYVNSERAKLGAIQNRLDHTVSNLTNIATNTEASRSRIMDADYGAESANLARSQIIQQAATAMLAQANQSAQSVLSLLQ
jgi:flagellin